jgi:RNA-directed DNA polymerase
LWRWARRRHPDKNLGWIKAKYFTSHRGRNWTFFGETCDEEGKPQKVWLFPASRTPITRHVKVKAEANPYDPAYETYFTDREGAHMRDSFRGTTSLRFLWRRQDGRCPVCHERITRLTGWRLYYRLPLVMGGSKGATNSVLLHPECRDKVHRLPSSCSSTASSPDGRSKGLSRIWRKS